MASAPLALGRPAACRPRVRLTHRSMGTWLAEAVMEGEPIDEPWRGESNVDLEEWGENVPQAPVDAFEDAFEL